MDCHSTLTPRCLPHSTNVSPTALSVMSFQLAENQTLNTPAAGAAACVPGVAAAAAALVGAGAAPGGALVGCAPAPAAGWFPDGGGAQAARASPMTHAFR